MPPSPLGLYAHFPYCPSRCPYCDFYALAYEPGPARALLPAMLRHLDLLAPLAQGRRLRSLYLGGGTPSLWPVSGLAGLLKAVDKKIGLAAGAEISLEANPGTLSLAKLRGLRQAGFNRLSLGAQSFQPHLLRILGRRHSAQDTVRAAAQARQAGFENLSLDLIYGLPGQDLDLAQADLRAALELSPDHLSLYELTLGPETPFGRAFTQYQPPLPSEGLMVVMEDQAREFMERAGLKRYEVSNFSRLGRECRHNQDTWRGGDYLALGPGAHGHLAGRRWALKADLGAYLEAAAQGQEALEFSEELTPQQRALELIMLGLRTVEGVDLEAVRRVLGSDPMQPWADVLGRLRVLGWARLAGTRLLPTSLGLRMADAAAALFA